MRERLRHTLAARLLSTITHACRDTLPRGAAQRLHVDAAGYMMAKRNWFNGLCMRSVYDERLDGRLDAINGFRNDGFEMAISLRRVARG